MTDPQQNAMENDPAWIVYILLCADATLYTGITTDLPRRVAEHASGTGAKYTRSRGPYAIVYTEQHATRSEASAREYYIKRLTKRAKLTLIATPESARQTHSESAIPCSKAR